MDMRSDAYDFQCNLFNKYKGDRCNYVISKEKHKTIRSFVSYWKKKNKLLCF